MATAAENRARGTKSTRNVKRKHLQSDRYVTPAFAANCEQSSRMHLRHAALFYLDPGALRKKAHGEQLRPEVPQYGGSELKGDGEVSYWGGSLPIPLVGLKGGDVSSPAGSTAGWELRSKTIFRLLVHCSLKEPM